MVFVSHLFTLHVSHERFPSSTTPPLAPQHELLHACSIQSPKENSRASIITINGHHVVKSRPDDNEWGSRFSEVLIIIILIKINVYHQLYFIQKDHQILVVNFKALMIIVFCKPRTEKAKSLDHNFGWKKAWPHMHASGPVVVLILVHLSFLYFPQKLGCSSIGIEE